MTLPPRAAILLFAMSLSGCYTVQYDKGMVVKDPTGKYTGLAPRIDLKVPPISVSVLSNPDYQVLTFGPPLLPIPVIPWPPGLFQIAFHKSRYQPTQNKLRIAISFSAQYSPGNPRASDFIFSPSSTKLVAGTQDLEPSEVECQTNQENAGQRCKRRSDGRYEIHIGVEGQPVGCVLSYPIASSDVKDAQLEIGDLKFMGEPSQVALSVKRGPTLRLEALGP